MRGGLGQAHLFMKAGLGKFAPGSAYSKSSLVSAGLQVSPLLYTRRMTVTSLQRMA